MGKKTEGSEGKLSDTIKKIVSVGVGAAFMTEDAVKGILGDLPLSKDILSGLVQNAKNTKEEFVSSIKDEIHAYLKTIDPKILVDHILEKYDMEVSATIKFSKRDKSTGKKHGAKRATKS